MIGKELSKLGRSLDTKKAAGSAHPNETSAGLLIARIFPHFFLLFFILPSFILVSLPALLRHFSPQDLVY